MKGNLKGNEPSAYKWKRQRTIYLQMRVSENDVAHVQLYKERWFFYNFPNNKELTVERRIFS